LQIKTSIKPGPAVMLMSRKSTSEGKTKEQQQRYSSGTENNCFYVLKDDKANPQYSMGQLVSESERPWCNVMN
jgi:hypothetical protein